MTQAEILAICKDYSPATVERDGRTRTVCLHRQTDPAGTEFCNHPAHFICDVLTRLRLAPKSLGGIPVSMTKATSWLRCQRAWAFRYFYRTAPQAEALPLTLGKVFAAARAKIAAGQPYEVPLALVKEPVEKAKLDMVLATYAENIKNLGNGDKTSEVELRANLGEVQSGAYTNKLILVGFADALTADKTLIDEWKYTTDPTSYDVLKTSMQASAYFYCLPEAKEFRLCAARRPAEKLLLATPEDKRKYKKCDCKGKKTDCEKCSGTGTTKELYAAQRERDETVEEYKARVLESLGAKGSFFTYETYLRQEFDVVGNIDIMRRSYDQWAEAVKTFRADPVGVGLHAFTPSYHNCDHCDFKAWCLRHSDGKTCHRMDDENAQVFNDECPEPQICLKVRIATELEASK